MYLLLYLILKYLKKIYIIMIIYIVYYTYYTSLLNFNSVLIYILLFDEITCFTLEFYILYMRDASRKKICAYTLKKLQCCNYYYY